MIFPFPSTLGGWFRYVKKHRDLVPLVLCVVGSGTLATVAGTYFIFQKPDVQIKRSGVCFYEKVDPETPQKLWTQKQKYEKIPELEALRREIGLYESK